MKGINDKQLKEILNQLHYDEAICVGGLIADLKTKLEKSLTHIAKYAGDEYKLKQQLQAEQQAHAKEEETSKCLSESLIFAHNKIIEMDKAHNELREKLKSIEWIDFRCIACGRNELKGHAKSCWLSEEINRKAVD